MRTTRARVAHGAADIGPDRYPEDLSLVRGVRPGITAAWQVTGTPGVDHARRADIDRHDVLNPSLSPGVIPLLRTARKLHELFAPARGSFPAESHR